MKVMDQATSPRESRACGKPPSIARKIRRPTASQPADSAVRQLLAAVAGRTALPPARLDPGYGDIVAAARLGVRGPGGPLPQLDHIQRSFGRHDVSGVVAHTDAAAAEGARAMGAEGFATGDHVAFAGPPSLHTAAHEAAHVVQQRAGVHLQGGVGQAGDAYEQHADRVADRVVRGQSAEPVLDEIGRSGGGRQAAPEASAPIQRLHGSFDPASYAAANATQVHLFLYLVRLLGAAHSDVLRASLVLSGVPDSNTDAAATGNQAHHIVEVNDVNAAPARTWLARAGIDIDSAVNGVLLPVAHADDTGDATVHVGAHVAGYAAEVNRVIRDAINADPMLAGAGITAAGLLAGVALTAAQQVQLRNAVRGALNAIRHFLLTNAIAINRGYRVDEDWDPRSKDRGKPDRRGGSGGGKTVRRAFREVFG